MKSLLLLFILLLWTKNEMENTWLLGWRRDESTAEFGLKLNELFTYSYTTR